MKKIGFLSFGHWTPGQHSMVRSASDALLQSIELAVAAEEVGADGAYYRVHHFAQQLASPFPLLAAAGAKTSRIELGTAVIDMRYENPLYMAEDAGAADLISGGRLQLGISRGSPEQVIDGYRYFGHVPGGGHHRRRPGARAHRTVPRGADRRGLRGTQPATDVPQPAGSAADRAALTRSARPDLVGRRHPRDRGVDRAAGDEPDELDAAHRGHRRAVPPAPGRADPDVPRRLEGGRSRAGAAGVGQPQHLPDRQRPRPSAVLAGDPQHRPGRVAGRRQRPLRQDLRRRAGQADRRAGRGRGDRGRGHRCC